ncbi:MAG: hypothetical protein HQ511_05005 [Rhodospirillales bacterium]|nr:hypothetical protein [Rhodospirillales bacterium]
MTPLKFVGLGALIAGLIFGVASMIATPSAAESKSKYLMHAVVSTEMGPAVWRMNGQNGQVSFCRLEKDTTRPVCSKWSKEPVLPRKDG